MAAHTHNQQNTSSDLDETSAQPFLSFPSCEVRRQFQARAFLTTDDSDLSAAEAIDDL